MTEHSQKIRYFRTRIPSFDCVPGCHDCCGPVRVTTTEIALLPEKSELEHQAALDAWSCPYLGATGCEVYGERPLICRLFGTTPRLVCPKGRRPKDMIEPELEREIFEHFNEVRLVLL